MAATHEGQNIFLDAYPFEKEICRGLSPYTPLFVDISGGNGSQCVALRQRLPHVQGRVINQDLPPVIAQAIPHECVEHTVNDFLSHQPIQGHICQTLLFVLHC